jgi:hypothetical protein
LEVTVPVRIICTKQDCTTITAQATADSAVTWTLHVTQQDGTVTDIPGTDSVSLNGNHTVTFSNVPNGTSYNVTADILSSTRTGDGVTQPVPFGTCP